MHKHVYKCPNHTANLNNTRLGNKWCDIIIKVDGKKFRAHKHILAANLEYFDTMLSGNSFRESKEGVITMASVAATDMEAMITYAYTGEISLTDNNALSLLETANYLREDGIKQACIEFLDKYLKAEESFRAYNVAKSIDCLSLKNAAKSRILTNFENISQSNEYLDLDFKILSDILSDGKAQSVELQQILFEGIMRWILAGNRRDRINDLLSDIDVSTLPADYFVKYVGSIANRSNDDFGLILKDLMSWYYTSSESQSITKHQVEHSEQTLMILGGFTGKNISVQSYNFAERKWSQLQSITAAGETTSVKCAVLNDKFYFIIGESGSCSLSMFDPSTKLRTVLHSSSNILGWAAVCACSRFMYLCGGQTQGGSISKQVLIYDPQKNSFETLPPMGIPRRSAAAIFYRDCLHVLGGHDGSSSLNKVEKYDPDTKTWTELPSMCEPRSWHAVAVLDGKLYACGGYARNSVEVYDPAKNSWQLVANMNGTRWLFTLVPNKGKLLAIGRDVGEKSVEVYDPSKDQWQIDNAMTSGLEMRQNMGGLISSSCITDAQ